MHEYGIVIGRFQPFHNAHLELVNFALKQAKQLIIVLGSAGQAPDTMNPWSAPERAVMIRKCFSEEENARIEFVHAKDQQSNMMWIASVQSAIDHLTQGSDDIKLIGHKKDATSFYLKFFPQWGDYIETGFSVNLDATKVRENLFRQDKISIKTLVPAPVYEHLCEWMGTPEFQRLHDEFQEISNDKAAWDGSPYVPIFMTTDAVVICSGHVLVVRRRGKYGKGLIAWPGGYVNANEFLLDSCIRELKEETGIRVPADELKKYVVDKDLFDNPKRDLRGRLITQAYCIKLPDGSLPKVKGMDDADKAWWMTVNDFHVNESRFFADHYKIGCRFINRF